MTFLGWCRICGGTTFAEFDKNGKLLWSCSDCMKSGMTRPLGDKEKTK